ncbi:hypothetical protein NZK33_16755 [Cyanobium sp. FGCU-6]|nr:hypothetical protein [Cyanobium sp. FGCU6]
MAGLVQIIRLLRLIRPDVATLPAQLLQQLPLHRHRKLQQHQQQPSGQQGQAALLVQRCRRLKAAVVLALRHLAAASARPILSHTKQAHSEMARRYGIARRKTSFRRSGDNP